MMAATVAADRVGPGTVVDSRYVIQQEIGRGNMSTVYLAKDELANREVVLKIMSDRLLGRPDRVQRFFNEHRFTTRIGRHENIVATLGDGRIHGDHGTPYLAMERVVGLSLDIKRALDRDWGSERVARVTLGVARGLQAVHAAGLVHRDVKPGNVLVARSDDGETDVAKLLDFGLAVLVGSDGAGEGPRRLTRAGELPGSAGYMPPESMLYAVPHPSADVFGLGVLLADTITGRPSFDGVPRDEYLAQVTLPDWSFPQRVLDRIESPQLRAIVVDCTQREPDDRPTLSEVIGRLEAIVLPVEAETPAPIVFSRPAAAQPIAPPSPAAPKPGSQGAWRWLAAAVALVVAALGVALWLGADTQDAPLLNGAAGMSAQGEPEPAPRAASTTREADTVAPKEAVVSDVAPEGVGSTDDGASSTDDSSQEPAGTSAPEPVPSRPKRRQRNPSQVGKAPAGDTASDDGTPEPATPAAGPDEAECAAIRRSIADLHKRGLWSRIPFLAEASRACFDATEYRRIRVEAFAESGRYGECIEAAGNSNDPKIRAWVDQCNEKQR